MHVDKALNARAKSSAKLTIRLTFTPGAGSKFIDGDHRAGPDFNYFSLHAIIQKFLLQDTGVHNQALPVDLLSFLHLGFKQRDRRKLESF